MTADVDLAIVGAGFGGSLLAMIAARLGLRVMLLERGRHPRFAIGESASPLAGVLLEQLADRYDLPRIRPLASYGPWMRTHPTVMRGVKRGFTYFKHDAGRPYAVAPGRTNQLLVAASPSDEISDTHWLRADVDHCLLQEALALGVAYQDRLAIDALEWEGGDPVLSGIADSRTVRVRARFVVDATGPRGALSRLMKIDAPGFAGYPSTQALYSHFVDVARCADMPVYQTDETPPYPIDAAALHHVFDGGWMWVLRFDNGVTSAGVAMTDALAAELRLSDGEAAWRRLLARYPSIAEQFAPARPIREFTWMPRLAWRTNVVAGDRWAMLPSAAAFVDPLFSTGIPMTLLGIERLARALDLGRTLAGPAYAAPTLAEADHAARFVAGCYAAFPRFERFTAYAMFYFAAASFSEMSRRLGQPGRGFLCADDRPFADAVARLSPAGRNDVGDDDVAREIDRLNIAGLCEPAKRNWYDVDFADAIRGAAKLGVSEADVQRLILSISSGTPG